MPTMVTCGVSSIGAAEELAAAFLLEHQPLNQFLDGLGELLLSGQHEESKQPLLDPKVHMMQRMGVRGRKLLEAKRTQQQLMESVSLDECNDQNFVRNKVVNRTPKGSVYRSSNPRVPVDNHNDHEDLPKIIRVPSTAAEDEEQGLEFSIDEISILQRHFLDQQDQQQENRNNDDGATVTAMSIATENTGQISAWRRATPEIDQEPMEPQELHVPTVPSEKTVTTTVGEQEEQMGLEVPLLFTKVTRSKPQWKSKEDPLSGRTYYYHRKTRETTWQKPQELVEFEEKMSRPNSKIQVAWDGGAAATSSSSEQQLEQQQNEESCYSNRVDLHQDKKTEEKPQKHTISTTVIAEWSGDSYRLNDQADKVVSTNISQDNIVHTKRKKKIEPHSTLHTTVMAEQGNGHDIYHDSKKEHIRQVILQEEAASELARARRNATARVRDGAYSLVDLESDGGSTHYPNFISFHKDPELENKDPELENPPQEREEYHC